MKKPISAVWPYVTILLFIPVYFILHFKLLVDIFGSDCGVEAQTNKLNIGFNADDLKCVVFALFTVGMTVWSIFLPKRFQSKTRKILYCLSVFLCNAALSLFFVAATHCK